MCLAITFPVARSATEMTKKATEKEIANKFVITDEIVITRCYRAICRYCEMLSHFVLGKSAGRPK